MDVDVVFTLTGDIRWNSRALKQLRLLSSMGADVLAFGIGQKAAGIQQSEGITIRTLKRPDGSGPRFFKRVHDLIAASVREISAQVYHASDLYTLPALAHAAKEHGGKLVYDARELYPYVASTKGRPWIRWFWQAIERYYIKRADFVSTVSPSIAEKMATAYRIDPPLVLYNVPEFKTIASSSRLREALSVQGDKRIILHQGNIQKDRGCFVLAEAMDSVDDAILVFLGGGPLKKALQDHVDRIGLNSRVRFMSKVDPTVLLDFTASADIGVTLLEDTCMNHRFALPNKLFEYCMAGVPVVASDLPEIRRIVSQFEVGLLVDPSNKDNVAKGLRTLVKEPGRLGTYARNTSAVFETFSWEKASQGFVSRYKELLSL